MRLRSLKVTLISLIVIAPLACARGPELKGIVRDAGAQPVPGAHIKLVGPGDRKTETETRSDGTYSVRLPQVDNDDAMLTVSVEKPGFLKFERHLTVGEARQQQSV